jgi:hypothetical protein
MVQQSRSADNRWDKQWRARCRIQYSKDTWCYDSNACVSSFRLYVQCAGKFGFEAAVTAEVQYVTE